VRTMLDIFAIYKFKTTQHNSATYAGA